MRKLLLALDFLSMKNRWIQRRLFLDGFRTSRFARFFEPAIFCDAPRKEEALGKATNPQVLEMYFSGIFLDEGSRILS